MSGTIKTKQEIEILRRGGKLLAGILKKVTTEVRAGVSTGYLDRLAESLIFESGGTPSFKGYKIKGVKTPYPASLCTSINDEIVHAIPHENRLLQEGDIVGVDIGMRWPATNGLYTDMAVTVGVGKISKEAAHLIKRTEEALAVGIHAVRAGVKIGDIGYKIQKYLEHYGYGVVRDLAGHGVGYKLHEEPLIPNFGKPGTGSELFENMVIAIEPMATLGSWKIELLDDEWTFRTADKSISAHFEHSLVVTKSGAEILTI